MFLLLFVHPQNSYLNLSACHLYTWTNRITTQTNLDEFVLRSLSHIYWSILFPGKARNKRWGDYMETHSAWSVNHQIPQHHICERKSSQKKKRSVFDPVSTVDNSYSFGSTESFWNVRLLKNPFYFVNYTCIYVFWRFADRASQYIYLSN